MPRVRLDPATVSGGYCLICGAGPFLMVGQHSRQIHGLPRAEYLRRFPGADMTPPEYKVAWDTELAEKGMNRKGGKRQLVCDRGHPLTGRNVARYAGGRRCRICANDWQRGRQRLPARGPQTCDQCGAVFQPGSRGHLPASCPACRRRRQREQIKAWDRSHRPERYKTTI